MEEQHGQGHSMGAPDLAGFGVTFKVWVLVNHVSDGFIRHIQIFGNAACGDTKTGQIRRAHTVAPQE